MDHYPDAPPSRGWPASHARRIDALERNLPAAVFTATLLGTSLPHYVPPQLLEQARALASQYPGGAVVLALVLLLGGAKIPPPADPRLRALWELWARWAPSQWDRWGGLKLPGRIEPEPPPPVAPEVVVGVEPPPPPTQRSGYPAPGSVSLPDEDPRGRSPRDGGSP